MTIYTFGDPELLREILLALATIFNLVEWSDPGSALGLGGNMLAVALIALVGIGIAGITSQQVRVDYLLAGLILFGVMFASKVDVNVEDVQTGDSAVVADIPIGIAAVAAASSSAANSLTETVSVALQRPGSTTSVLTDNGFLDPLRTLLSIGEMGVEDIDANLQRSMLEYYRICVGRTKILAPGTFDMDEFLSVPDPATYLLADANIVNFSTIYYDDANPGGVATACYAANDLIQTRLNDIADGTTNEIETYLQRALGAKLYNTSFVHGDIDDAVDIIFRGLMTGQEFMANLFVRNLFNEMEALSTAEYGTNATQYVAQVTQAFEGQRSSAATEGTVFLQMMFPLMTFVQFLFFAIAPFIALVMIASPFSSAKVLGTYLLFGVWAYSWMPIAAIINHYMEISLQNNIDFSDVIVSGSGYTAISGFSDFYNLAASKITIGSNALAATPFIVLGILSGAVTTIAGRLGGFSQAGNANRVDTSITRPKLGQNAPLVQAGGRASFATGTTLSEKGLSGAASGEQSLAYRDLQLGQAASTFSGIGRQSSQSATEAFSSSLTKGSGTISETIKEGGFGSQISQTLTSQSQKSFSAAVTDAIGYDQARHLTAGNLRNLEAFAAVHGIFVGIKESTSNSVLDSKAFGEIQSAVASNAGSIQASVLDSLADTVESSGKDSGRIRETASELRESQSSFDAAQRFEDTVRDGAESISQLGASTYAKTTEVAGIGIRRHGNDVVTGLDTLLTGNYGAFANDVKAGAQQLFNEQRPVGLDGFHGLDDRGDFNADLVDQISTRLGFLSNEAAKGNEVAAHALLNSLNYLAGVGDRSLIESTKGNLAGVQGAQGEIDFREELLRSASERNDAFRDSVGSESAATTASARAKATAGGSTAPTRSTGGSPHIGAHAANAEAAARAGLSSEGFDKASARFNSVVDTPSVEDQNISGALVNWAKPTPGYNRALEEGLAPLASLPGTTNDPVQQELVDGLADHAVGRLERAVIEQFDNQRGQQVQASYQAFQDAEFTKKQAAFAAYGETGARLFGASDALYAGLFGAAGASAAGKGGKSILSLARVGGGAAGLALYAGMVGIAVAENKEDAKQAQNRIAELLKADFAEAGGGNAERFNLLIDQAQGTEGIFEVLGEFYGDGQSGSLTDAQIQKLDESREPGFWEKVGKNYIDSQTRGHIYIY